MVFWDEKNLFGGMELVLLVVEKLFLDKGGVLLCTWRESFWQEAGYSHFVMYRLRGVEDEQYSAHRWMD
jgi:hypothetical protein